MCSGFEFNKAKAELKIFQWKPEHILIPTEFFEVKDEVQSLWLLSLTTTFIASLHYPPSSFPKSNSLEAPTSLTKECHQKVLKRGRQKFLLASHCMSSFHHAKRHENRFKKLIVIFVSYNCWLLVLLLYYGVEYFMHYLPACSCISDIHLAKLGFFQLLFWLYLLRITPTEQQHSSTKYI